jgi:hypothetical protein
MSEKCVCNICADEITDLSKKVTLECNPKHIFCYNCIYEWYDTNKDNKPNNYNDYQYKPTSCPLCFKYGGFLPLPKDDINIIVGIENIHYSPENYIKKSSRCDCISKIAFGTKNKCNSYPRKTIMTSNDKVIKLCYSHYFMYSKGDDLLILTEDNKEEVVKSIFGKVQCCVHNKNGDQCNGNSNIKKNGLLLYVENNNLKYKVCNKHYTSYNSNKNTGLNVGNNTIIYKEMPKKEENKCNSLLKNGKYCTNKSHEKYGNKCAKHSIINNSTSSNSNVIDNEIINKYNSLYNEFSDIVDKLKIYHDECECFCELENNKKQLKNNIENIKNIKIEDLENNISNINNNVNFLYNNYDKKIMK